MQVVYVLLQQLGRRKCPSGKRDSESCIVCVQQCLGSKPSSLSHSHVGRKLQEKEMDSVPSVLEREINSSKCGWRGAALRHSCCAMAELGLCLL